VYSGICLLQRVLVLECGASVMYIQIKTAAFKYIMVFPVDGVRRFPLCSTFCPELIRLDSEEDVINVSHYKCIK
jgi:hypothetical protein